MRRALILAVALACSACATTPHRIAPVANVGPCTAADRANLAALTKQQQSAATTDVIGVILVGVPVASLTGADREAELAILKGRCTP